MKPLAPEQLLHSAEFLSLEELAAAVPGFSDRLQHYITEGKDDDGENVKGIYFNEVGYQRKSMCNEFYRVFPPDFISAEKNIFETVYSFLIADHIADLPNRQREFKETFLDIYVEGESLIMMSR